MQSYEIRKLEKRDNLDVARLIRAVMPEFGASGAGFAILDREVDDMHSSYSQARSCYFVVYDGARVVGGAGIAPLQGGDLDTCELRKMYFLSELRGKGYGQKLMDLCLDAARTFKFTDCYLETLENMTSARSLYEKNGFKPLTKPMGSTGHFGCNAWYSKKLL